jgi:hypothetical protein
MAMPSAENACDAALLRSGVEGSGGDGREAVLVSENPGHECMRATPRHDRSENSFDGLPG